MTLSEKLGHLESRILQLIENARLAKAENENLHKEVQQLREKIAHQSTQISDLQNQVTLQGKAGETSALQKNEIKARLEHILQKIESIDTDLS